MPSAIHYRLLGQTATFAMHAGNSVVMLLSMQDQELMKDTRIRDMVSMQGRYLTVWNIAFQMSYFALALACDFTTVTGTEHIIPKSLRQFRQKYFASVVFPVSALVFALFWPMFLYDRELLFPAFIDKIFSFNSNLVMHFFILPAVLWELAFLKRPIPKSHKLSFGVISLINFVYNSFIAYTHSTRGLFPYPILYMVYGTIWYALLHAFIYILGLGLYLLQWKLTAFFWGKEENKLKKK